MSITYQLAGDEVHRIAGQVMKEYEPELHAQGVTVDVTFARSNTGPAVKVHGRPAVAKVKVNSLVDRAKGAKDASIVVDEAEWDGADARKRQSLLYHELHHLELVYPKATKKNPNPRPGRDDLGRPKLRLRPHDKEIGTFDCVIDEFGKDSFDHDQLEGIHQYVQKLFAWG